MNTTQVYFFFNLVKHEPIMLETVFVSKPVQIIK